ncbi:hypothetical protein KI659_00030 [Litoribacter alkaliphilus]|uniref:Uncharacterized protein n=1 Tax=Litoribacter ruber TaxID=702568 RepID=A0AAP2CDT5_9BACT|nr:hypothetical protein [Litoribacter alkaliphilus]MBS9522391.1 hypothetical protein [Litoribacter alkaliphilus]
MIQEKNPIQENVIVLTGESLKWVKEHFKLLEKVNEKFTSLEEKITSIKGNQPLDDLPKSPLPDYFSLPQFKAKTGLKSHYSIQKLETIAETKGMEFKSIYIGKRRYIHQREVERFFAGEFKI